MLTFDTRLDTLPHIQKPQWLRFKRLGLETVHDLLMHFPARYEDLATIVPIGQVKEDAKVTIEGRVTEIEVERSWKKRMLLTRALIQDESGTIRVIWFNQRFVGQTLKKESRVRLSGKVVRDRDGLVMMSPDFERSEREATHTGRLVPVYPETAGLSSKFLRWQLALVFQKLENFPDPVPEDILAELHLPDLKTALAYLHFPKNEKQVLLAEKRFAFDEMFLLQLKTEEVRAVANRGRALPVPLQEDLIKTTVTKLPFTLTVAQKRSLGTILHDLKRERPMNRLLNGDVGSGKTIVAALAARSAVEAKYQVALLAPTEILARQHFETFTKLFSSEGVNIALLTANFHELGRDSVTRTTLLKAIHSGIAHIVIGTHALLQEDVRFEKLALVVVDEQQRFGVAQRARLQSLSYASRDLPAPHPGQYCIYVVKCADDSFYIGQTDNYERRLKGHGSGQGAEWTKNHLPFETIHWEIFSTREEAVKREHDLKTGFGRKWLKREYEKGRLARQAGGSTATIPHFLTMTATPIPRTLALTVFGNLDLSLLDELPKHKKPITTKVATSEKDRDEVYEFMRSEIARGRQAFIIFPLVEESKAMEEVKAATAEHKRLSEKVFPDLSLGLLHGRMKSKEKEKVMRDFQQRKHHILVSTAVVEVGIDIPNATIILIEEAERFGLSQLHQFRGRVGRGSEQSFCFLFPGKNSSAENKRLQAMEKISNGFELAEIDLKLRGPGTFLGERQSGLPDIAFENLTNLKLIEIAREKAKMLLEKDPALHHHPLLRRALNRFEERIHLE